MKVARLHGTRDIRLSDEPTPEPEAGECLVRVEAVGICGSDLHWFEEGAIGDATLAAPVVPGHEFAGVVEKGPLAGTRVAVDPAIPCLRCDLCLEGHPNLQRVAPLRIGQTIKEVLEADLAGEYDARKAYKSSRELCESLGDYVSKNLFEELLADEEGHIDFLETQLQLLNSIGQEKYIELNSESADKAE